MLKKGRLTILVMLLSVIIASAPAIFLGEAQIQSSPEEELVELAYIAKQQVKNLIDLLYANETALQKIEEVGLFDDFEENVTLYEEGVKNLTAAYDSLEISDYETAIDYATQALCIFREVYRSIHVILRTADLQKGDLIDSQGLLEAITRELQRIDRLREILPMDVPLSIIQLLDDAEAYLTEGREMLLDGAESEALDNLQQAKDLISNVYQYLKERAQESNVWRISGYCDRVRERIRERFRYGNQAGIDFTQVIETLGYQSENQFMELLENTIQKALGKTEDFENALQDLEDISQMVQEMDQALTEEINRHQNQYGTSSNAGSYGAGNTGNNYGHGSSGNKP